MAGSRRIAGIAVAALMVACAAGEPGIDVPPPPPTEGAFPISRSSV